jgi:hypothetical protein
MKIHRRLLSVVVAATALLVAAPAFAQATSNQSSSGSMTLFLPIALIKNTDLSFGTVTRPTSGSGNVNVNATTGAVTATGGINTVNNGPNAPASRATFTVTGEGGMNFTVAVPSTFNMTRAGNQDPIQVTLSSTMGSGTLSGSYGGSGTATFGVGGAVVISSATPTGAYTGNFTVTVAYN